MPRDRGSAPVEFVLVGSLVVFLFLGVLQLGLLLHMRNVVVASASEAARTAGNADRDCADAARRFDDLVASALSSRVVDGIRDRRCTVDADAGASVVRFQVDVALPLVFLPFGSVSVTATGRALEEGS
ncbi:MAG TPA: TadE/TadG family type IV pilus assembly protein [Mycobacteriales bacterium]|nr:TadE/TadG family type IV pilus assembly protein [Mycobacteriales bacterium]